MMMSLISFDLLKYAASADGRSPEKSFPRGSQGWDGLTALSKLALTIFREFSDTFLTRSHQSGSCLTTDGNST